MAEYLTNTTDLTKIASAIRAKGGTSDSLVYPDGFVTAIENIQTGGGTKPGAPGDITFYDYDGTIVTSWTLEELATKTALPDYPSHEGIICQGWNWTLEKIKSLTRPMNIGAMYITDDGKTRLNIRVWDKARATVPLYFYQDVANGVSIDWGDGSAPETNSNTGWVHSTHTYAADGSYTISITIADGCSFDFGNDTSSYSVMGSTGDNGIVYCNMLQSVHIGEGVTSIGKYAFSNCYSLQSITIPYSVTSIADNAFYVCYSLQSITIPYSVTGIGNHSFNSCYSLQSITISDGVKSIGNSAFNGCYSLLSITIPYSVTSIGNYAFSNCQSLQSITISDGVKSIGNNAFRYCYGMASFTIPDGVKSIEQNTFFYCHSLQSITIPGSVTSIADNAFYNCGTLASITIQDGVTSIGNSAFSNCKSLSSITIPYSVTSIGNYAFSACYGMAEYHMKPTTPPIMSGTNVFNKIPSDCIIYVPKGSLNAYKSATNWSSYTDYMREEAA